MALVAATPAPAQAPPAAPPATRISGYLFGDAYGVAGHHQPGLQDQTGFWIRRAYLTFDHTIAPHWSSRLRFEVNSPGDFSTDARLEPFVKDLYLQWQTGAHQLLIGISPSPIWARLEDFWGLRHIEKTPADLYRLSSSREFGLSWKASSTDGRFFAHASVGNGAGEKSETNKGKKVALAVGFAPSKALLLEAYADVEDRPENTDRQTWQIFGGWQSARGRVGLQYVAQRQEMGLDPSRTITVGSVFGVLNVGESSSLIARVDRVFDPHPDADKIPYLVLFPHREFDLILVGYERRLNPQISLAPNLEVVS
ncbi:MAG: hypothetical protein WD043_02320, partial [Gemmatimonadales bacterium]